MINLLSTESKNELKAARRNITLRKYVLTLLFLNIVIAGTYTIGYIILTNQTASYRKEISTYEPERKKFQDTIQRATQYSENLAIAKSILSNELQFSNLTITIARTLPPNVTLTSLSISAKDIAKPISLNFGSKSYADAIKLKESFQESPYFTDTKIRSIDKSTEGNYPYQVALITTFNKQAFVQAQKEGRL